MKNGDVFLRFLRDSNYLAVYLRPSGDLFILKLVLNDEEVVSAAKLVHRRLTLPERLGFLEMDPYSTSRFICGRKGIDMGHTKTGKVNVLVEPQLVEVSPIEIAPADESEVLPEPGVNEEEEEEEDAHFAQGNGYNKANNSNCGLEPPHEEEDEDEGEEGDDEGEDDGPRESDGESSDDDHTQSRV